MTFMIKHLYMLCKFFLVSKKIVQLIVFPLWQNQQQIYFEQSSPRSLHKILRIDYQVYRVFNKNFIDRGDIENHYCSEWAYNLQNT